MSFACRSHRRTLTPVPLRQTSQRQSSEVTGSQATQRLEPQPLQGVKSVPHSHFEPSVVVTFTPDEGVTAGEAPAELLAEEVDMC